MTDPDILRDFLDRLLAAQAAGRTFSAAFLVGVEREVRRDWAGERVYIASHDDADRRRVALDALARGAAAPEAAAESGLTRRSIYRLLKRSGQ